MELIILCFLVVLGVIVWAASAKPSGVATAPGQEVRRSCRACGKVWHSDPRHEAHLHRQKNLTDVSLGFGAFGGASPANLLHMKNSQSLKRDLHSLRRCPNCGSGQYDEQAVSY